VLALSGCPRCRPDQPADASLFRPVTPDPIAATPVAHRPLLAYDTAAGLTQPLTTTAGATAGAPR
jgi:hypothetical protein